MKKWQIGAIIGAIWGYIAWTGQTAGYGLPSVIIGLPLIIGGPIGVWIFMISAIKQCSPVTQECIKGILENLTEEQLMQSAMIPTILVGALIGSLIGFMLEKRKLPKIKIG